MQIIPISIGIFGSLIFVLWLRRDCLRIQEVVSQQVLEEAARVVSANYLAYGEVPSRSQLISICRSVSVAQGGKGNVSLEPLLDRLVYEVLADDLLPESQKSQLSQSLAARKREPLETWEYAQLVAASEEVVQKRWELSYNRQLAALAVLATLLVGLHLENGRLPVTITEGLIDFSLSFGVLVGLYSIWSLNRRPVAYIPAVGGESRQSQQQNSQHQESDSLEGLPQYSDLPAPASPQDEHQNSTEDEEASLFHPSYQAL